MLIRYSTGAASPLLAPLSLLGLAMGSSTVHADMLGVYHPSPFTGPYIGLQAGYGITGIDIDYDIDGIEGETDDDEHGFNGGLYTGYSGVVDRLFGGVEIDGSLSTVEWRESANGVTSTVEQDFSIGVSALIGFLPREDIVLYGRLGYVYTEFSGELTDGTVTIEDEEGFNGFRAGVGADLALAEHISARAEYSFTTYEETDVSSGDDSISYSPYEHLARVGVAYRF